MIPQPLDFGIHFDATKHIRLVPSFQEKEVKYFLHFEKVAENLKWPKEHWTLLLQSVIIGKAREIYTQLTDSSYDTVKELILKRSSKGLVAVGIRPSLPFKRCSLTVRQ